MTAAATTPRGVPAGSQRAARVSRWLRTYLPPLVVFVATVLLWEAAVRSGALRGVPLPAPSQIVDALAQNWASGRWPRPSRPRASRWWG